MLKQTSLKELLELHEQGELQGVFRTSNEDYHAAPGLSRSILKQMDRTPEDARFKMSIEEKPSNALILGQAAHVSILEPDKAEALIAIGPKVDKRTKVWKEFVADNKGKYIISQAAANMIAKWKDRLSKHPRRKVLDGFHELSFFWVDPETGLQCKCRPDNLTMLGDFVDLKTTKDASTHAFRKDIHIYGYDLQAAMVLEGVPLALKQSKQKLPAELKEAIGKISEESQFFFVLLEKPTDTALESIGGTYLVRIVQLGTHTVNLGARTLHRRLREYMECEMKGKFPGYPDEIEVVDAADWVFNAELEDSDEELME